MQGKLSVPRVFQRSTMRSRLGIEKGEPVMGRVDGENEELRDLGSRVYTKELEGKEIVVRKLSDLNILGNS